MRKAAYRKMREERLKRQQQGRPYKVQSERGYNENASRHTSTPETERKHSHLTSYLNSSYIHAMNQLGGQHARQRIVAYVESYDDVFFWSNLLRPLETDKYFFEVMLPSRTSLCKGKKIAMANDLGNRLGHCMIACVDADYDYLMQGATLTSAEVCNNPYIFHTYVYAIENFQCYAPGLQNVCVMATLNDHHIFDFEAFLRNYSVIIWPLFVWNIWCYRYGTYKQFSMLDFYHIVQLQQLNFYHPEQTLEHLRHLVNAKINRLQKQFPQGRTTYKPLREELLQLGLTPETTYLYMRGHDLFDGIASPLLSIVCEQLRREREREIRHLAEHSVQMQNELSAYQNATGSIEEMLRKHTSFTDCPQYKRIQNDVRRLIAQLEATQQTTTNDNTENKEHGMQPLYHGGDGNVGATPLNA